VGTLCDDDAQHGALTEATFLLSSFACKIFPAPPRP
jgi:hypothetical protein